MGDSATDSEPPSGAALAVALARAEATGLLAAHDAYGPDLVGYAEFVLGSRPAPDDGPQLADEAAAAVLDALLVATVAAGDLTDPTRMRAWLLALTRNECLRRRPGAGASAAREAAELGRRGLRPAEVAALIDAAPRALADPAPRDRPAAGTVPGWLRDELVAASGPAGMPRRRALARRARPFDPDGFPVPLDRRRLPVAVLAWSAAVAVVLALGVLVAMPTRGSAAAVQQGPLLAAASEAAAEAARPVEEPLPTLAEAPFGSAGATVPPRPEPAADRGAPRSEVTPTPAPTTTMPRERTRAEGGRAVLTLTWSQVRCGEDWTAAVRATTGGAEVTGVVVTGGTRTVSLDRDGDGWSGQLDGLPTDRPVVVMARADGAVRPAVTRLTATC